MATHNKITPEEIEIIKNSNLTIKELSNLLKRHPLTIGRIVKQYEIKLPKSAPYRKYSLNENFFKTWTKEMAYTIGFIMADGNIKLSPRNGGVLSIRLNIKDDIILKNIKKFINTDAPITYKYYPNRNYCNLNICSRIICEDLIKLGVIENKTYRVNIPKSTPTEYIQDLIRGIFDGDGCAEIKKPKLSPNNNLSLKITGQKALLENIKNIYYEFTKINQGSLRKQLSNCFDLVFSGIKSSILFGNFLFNNSTPETRLERKYCIYKNFYNQYAYKLSDKRSGKTENRFNAHNRKLTLAIVKEIRKLFDEDRKTQKQIKELMNIDSSTISRIINNKTWEIENYRLYEQLGY